MNIDNLKPEDLITMWNHLCNSDIPEEFYDESGSGTQQNQIYTMHFVNKDAFLKTEKSDIYMMIAQNNDGKPYEISLFFGNVLYKSYDLSLSDSDTLIKLFKVSLSKKRQEKIKKTISDCKAELQRQLKDYISTPATGDEKQMPPHPHGIHI